MIRPIPRALLAERVLGGSKIRRATFGWGPPEAERTGSADARYRFSAIALRRGCGGQNLNTIWTVFEDKAGFLWISTFADLRGLTARQDHRSHGISPGGPVTPRSLSLHRSPKTSLGICGSEHTAVDCDATTRGTGRFTAFRHNAAQSGSLPNDFVPAVIVSRDGTVWVATGAGVAAFDQKSGRFRTYRVDAEAKTAYRVMAEASDGAIWLGTYESGVRRLDPSTGQFTFYPHDPGKASSLSNNLVNALLPDRSGVLSVGTSSGLNRFDPKTLTFVAYTERNGLSNDNVNGILEDETGSLWLSTNNGISRFDPRSKIFTNYTTADGLPTDEFFYGAVSSFRSREGEMYFSSRTALATCLPSRIVDNPYVPPVVLTDFQLFGKPVAIGGKSILKQPISVTKSLTLTYKQNVFGFEFSALSYANPQGDRYRYRLEGLEEQWNETDSSRRFVTYTTLAPGHYVFRVQGRTTQGPWSEPGLALRINVLPPLWLQPWFAAICVALILILLWLLYRYRLHQVAVALNVRMEERVNERTRIARDLHDTLLQSFHGLLLRFQAAYNMFPTRPDEARNILGSAIDEAALAITEGRDAIQGLRSATVETNDLALAVRTLGEELATAQVDRNSAVFSVEVEGTPRDLHPILRDEVYRIASEALRNAFKHARAHKIEVEIRYDERELRLRVRDDGKGIDPNVLSGDGRAGHFGLHGMRERAKLSGGQFTVWSDLESGTALELSIPASKAYATAPVTRSWFSEKSVKKFSRKGKDTRS